MTSGRGNRTAITTAAMRHRQNTSIRNNRQVRPVVTAAVQVVTDAIDSSGATAVDLNALASVLREAIRDGISDAQAAQRVDEQAPMFGAVGRFLNANPGLLAALALIVSMLALAQDYGANKQGDPPPTVTVQIQQPDRAEIERIVEEKLREQEEAARREKDTPAGPASHEKTTGPGSPRPAGGAPQQ